jgi:hypothetical protein
MRTDARSHDSHTARALHKQPRNHMLRSVVGLSARLIQTGRRVANQTRGQALMMRLLDLGIASLSPTIIRTRDDCSLS